MDDRPNILWVTMDSVRADHTTCYGYRRNTTPNLQAISDAEDGCFFKNCFSHGTGTPLSATSILTATYPCFHGVGVGSSAGHLRDDTKTVAQRLSETGYHTACITRNGYVGPPTGLDTGFDDYQLVHPKSILTWAHLPTLINFLIRLRQHSAGFETDWLRHSLAYVVTDISRRLFESADDSVPFFGYVHYNEPHRPYVPPISYIDKFTDDITYSSTEAADRSISIHNNVWKTIASGDLSDEDRDALVAMYDAEIAYTDSLVGNLIEKFKTLSSRPTIIIVTSDHGELFGHRGVLSHKFLVSDDLIHVPLWTDGFPEIHQHRDRLVQHADLITTLLSMVDADISGTQGIDLRGDQREHAIAQNSSPTALDPVREYDPDHTRLKFFESELLTAIRTQEFKYIRNYRRNDLLYFLPDESEDVSDRYQDRLEYLRGRHQKWMDDHCSQKAMDHLETNVDDALRQHLQSLGYRE